MLGPFNHLALLRNLRRPTALWHVGLAFGFERSAVLWQLLSERQEFGLAGDVLAEDLWDLKNVDVSTLDMEGTFQYDVRSLP